MEIREIGADQWKGYRELYLTLLKSDPGAFADSYQDILKKSEKEWVETLSRKGATFVAVVDNRFVGTGRINLYENLPGIPVLHKLGVLAGYRGLGIAKALVAAREAWARQQGAKCVRLYVVADRLKTIEFSHKNGYKIIESESASDFVKPAVIMEKSL